MLFRPPYGETNDQVRADEARLRVLEVLWTVWAGASTEEIVAAWRHAPAGRHHLDARLGAATIDAVPLIVSGLRKRA